MSDAISIINGKAEAIFTGERDDVWHRLGNYTGDQPITVEQLRGTVAVPAEKVEVTYKRPVAGGRDTVDTVSQKAFLVIRTDTGAELSSVGPDYTVIQHEDALITAIQPIVDAGFATIDTAGLLYGGAMGWSLIKWNLERFDAIVRDVYRDEIQAYGLALSNHRKGSNEYANVGRRAVCKNTIDMAMASGTLKTRVVHRQNGPARQLEAAQETFKHVIRHHVEMAEKYRKLQGTVLDLQQWKELVQEVAVPDPRKAPGFDPKSPRSDMVVERFKQKANRIYVLMREGRGSDGTTSAWNAYNGLVESMDHDVTLWKGRNEENRVMSLTAGPLAKIRETVFNNLVAITA